VVTAVSHAALPRGKPAAAQAVVAAMTSTLGARYQPAWPIALPGAHARRLSICTCVAINRVMWMFSCMLLLNAASST